mgnify:CR=1 FL=1
MSFYDEFLVPDFDPTERKTMAEYLALFKVAFDPHDTIIRNHKNANRIANNMVNVDGYSVEQMYSVVDEARAFHGLEKIERRPTRRAVDGGQAGENNGQVALPTATNA